MIKNNNIKIMGVFASVLLLVIIVTAAFAYFGSFNVNLNNNVAVNVNSVSPGNATFTSNATQLNLQVPAANMSQTAADNETPATENTATLTLNLTGAANLLTTCTYDIVYEYDTNSNVYGVSPTTKNGDKEVTIQVSGVNGTNNFASEKNFDSNTISSYKNGNVYTLVSGATIESNGTLTTQNISITGKYYNLTISQSSLEGKAFTGKIYVANQKCKTSKSVEYGYITILNNNGGKNMIEAKGEPDFSTIATENEGMYAAEDNLGTSYYFRGAIDNNWVQFGEYTQDVYDYSVIVGPPRKLASKGDKIYWRIVRINGDNSIRLIYSGTTKPTIDTKVNISGDNVISTVFNEEYDSAEYVGYMYTIGEQHGISEDSTIKTQLEDWYANYTNLNALNMKIADQIFCNDRTASTDSNGAPGEISQWQSTGVDYYYGANLRLNDTSNLNPSLICQNTNDKFTVNVSNGNGALTYPVGLITADEMVMAGLNGEDNSYEESNCYLDPPVSVLFGSPLNYLDGSANIYWLNGTMFAETDVKTSEIFLPVISLSTSVVLSGDGTYANPYTVN